MKTSQTLLTGGCHCGNLHVRLHLTTTPANTPLRACGCAFCRAHATRTVADPDGLVEISAQTWDRVEAYRFGSRTADYLVCRRCGVYVAAVCETSTGLRAVLNVNCLDDRARFTRPPSPTDYEGESTKARLARRAERWMPAAVQR